MLSFEHSPSIALNLKETYLDTMLLWSRSDRSEFSENMCFVFEIHNKKCGRLLEMFRICFGNCLEICVENVGEVLGLCFETFRNMVKIKTHQDISFRCFRGNPAVFKDDRKSLPLDFFYIPLKLHSRTFMYI